MKRFGMLLALLLALVLPCLAEEAVPYAPLTWEEVASPNKPSKDAYLPKNAGYHDDSLDIQIETFRKHKTTVMVARIKLMDATQLRTDTASRSKPWNGTSAVSTMAKRNKAVLAINGDYFSFHTDGIVWRNGVEYRHRPVESRDTLVIDGNGNLHVIVETTEEKWQALLETLDAPVIHAFTFGPALVQDGEAIGGAAQKKTENLAPGKATQRIAIGQTGPLEYLIAATEGPENTKSVGFTIGEMADLMAELGCTVAYNLDGGSSSTIVLNNKKINALSTGKIRSVSDCIWFATLVPGE